MHSQMTTDSSAKMSGAGTDNMMSVDSSTNTAQTEHNFMEEKKTEKRGKIFSVQQTGTETIDYRPRCNGFRILRTLGKGGNGVVKLVEKDGQEYAMKIFEPHPSEKDAFCMETEAELNLVKTHMIDDIPEYFEFVESATWQKKDGSNV